jgi:chemotaxis protein methyltransferase CheR
MDMNEAAMQVIADLLYAQTGQEITASRRWRIPAALTGVFRDLGIDSVNQLVCVLDRGLDPTLPRRVVEALLNNETYFFRDRNYFENLSQHVLPEIASRRAGTRHLRVWSAGCSTGQEPLSLAMLLAEQRSLWRGWTIEIVATDISSRALKAARSASYNQFEIQRGISVTEMLSHFTETKNQWKAKDCLRRMIRFEQRNLLEEPPAGGPFDLVLCRNVLLYFEHATRAHAFARLHAGMALDGWLMLGAGETLLEQPRLFKSAACGSGLYRQLPQSARAGGGPVASAA